jgi:hypothetical protein
MDKNNYIGFFSTENQDLHIYRIIDNEEMMINTKLIVHYKGPVYFY